jgi:outer membrane protein TolC
MHAANAQIGIATADLYPRINLSGAIAGEWLVSGPSGSAWSLIGGLAAPIFHGGSLKAQQNAAEETFQGAFAQYQQTVLAAFQQVADNLEGLSSSAEEVTTEEQALASASAALTLTRLGYGVGNAALVQVPASAKPRRTQTRSGQGPPLYSDSQSVSRHRWRRDACRRCGKGGLAQF